MRSASVLLFIEGIIIASLLTPADSGAVFAAEEPNGLVGRWDFDHGTGEDLSGKGGDADLGGARPYALGAGRTCLMFMPGAEPMRIPASATCLHPRR